MSGAISIPALLDILAVLAVGPLWWVSGKAAQRAKLPLITGYLVVRCSACPLRLAIRWTSRWLGAPWALPE